MLEPQMFNVFSVFLGLWLYITNGEAIQILNISIEEGIIPVVIGREEEEE